MKIWTGKQSSRLIPKRRFNKKIRLTLAGLLLTATLPSTADSLSVGDLAPDFEVTTLAGETFSLSSFQGKKPVYLKFWATWCSYCKAEMPHVQSTYNQYGDAVEVLMVNVGMNDSIANIKQLYNQKGYSLPTVFDREGELTSRYGVVGTPFHVLVDEQGRVAYQTFLASDELDDTIVSWSQQDKRVTNAAVRLNHKRPWKR